MYICQKLSFCCPWLYIRKDSYMFCKRYYSEEYMHTKIPRELTQVIYYEWVHYESCVHYCRVWILCVHIYILELWLWPSPDVYLSFLSVVRKHGISTFLAFKWRSAVKNPRQQETSVCIWMAEISGQSSCCSSKGDDFLDCEYDLSLCALLILNYIYKKIEKICQKVDVLENVKCKVVKEIENILLISFLFILYILDQKFFCFQ